MAYRRQDHPPHYLIPASSRQREMRLRHITHINMNRNADTPRCDAVFSAGGGNRAIWDTIYLSSPRRRPRGNIKQRQLFNIRTQAAGQQDIYIQYFCHALFYPWRWFSNLPPGHSNGLGFPRRHLYGNLNTNDVKLRLNDDYKINVHDAKIHCTVHTYSKLSSVARMTPW